VQFNYKVKYSVIIISILTGYFFLINYFELNHGITVCYFKNITGIPCPSCGSTRATYALLHGNVLSSILINPLAIITNFIIFISIFWMIFDIIKNKETFCPFLKRDWDTIIKIIGGLLILINWGWNIHNGL